MKEIGKLFIPIHSECFRVKHARCGVSRTAKLVIKLCLFLLCLFEQENKHIRVARYTHLSSNKLHVTAASAAPYAVTTADHILALFTKDSIVMGHYGLLGRNLTPSVRPFPLTQRRSLHKKKSLQLTRDRFVKARRISKFSKWENLIVFLILTIRLLK